MEEEPSLEDAIGDGDNNGGEEDNNDDVGEAKKY